MELVQAYRTEKCRLLPGTKAKFQALVQLAGAVRYVWNYILRIKEIERWVYKQQLIQLYEQYPDKKDKKALAEAKKKLAATDKPDFSFKNLSAMFTRLRKSKSHAWLKDVPSWPIRACLKLMERAYKQAFKQVAEAKRNGEPTWVEKNGKLVELFFPKPKGKRGDDYFILEGKRINLVGDTLHIPRSGYMTLVRQQDNPYKDSIPKYITVKQECNRFYAFLVHEVFVERKTQDELETIVGIDRNAKQVTTSAGDMYIAPDTKDLDEQIKRKKQKASQQQTTYIDQGPGRKPKPQHSKRKQKTYNEIAKLEHKKANRLKNYCHQVSRKIANLFDVVVLEKLDTQEMTSKKNKKGQPSKVSKQTRKDVKETHWFFLAFCLTYKAHLVLFIDPAYTSQTCSECGYCAKKNRRSQALFVCGRCDLRCPADWNAARNIEQLGLQLLTLPLKVPYTGNPKEIELQRLQM